jgi:hypothetical protein|tara:strand:- start:99 stop:329 length:231 start_codon:yes stop_codon:yes gene_type:complete
MALGCKKIGVGKDKITFSKEHGKFDVILDYANPHHLQIVVNKGEENWLEVELSLDVKSATIFGLKKNISVVEDFED